MEELGDKLEEGEKKEIETAIEALETAMKGDDKDDIEAKTQALTAASGKMAEKLYAQQPGGGDNAGDSASKKDDDVVDAEFEEVDTKK